MIGSRGPLITATAMKIFRGERVGTIYGTISIGSGLGSAIRLLGRRPDPRLDPQLQSRCSCSRWSAVVLGMIPFLVVINLVLGLIPFLVVPALRR